MDMKWLCVIPARGGSKGIPGKNLVDVGGKPMIAYTLEVARKLAERDRLVEVFVSTDSDAIRKTVEDFGFSVPCMRPPELSGDSARTVDVVVHVLEFYRQRGIAFDAVLLLQPTSPLRSFRSALEAMCAFESRSQGVESLISVSPYSGPPPEILYRARGGDGTGVPVVSSHSHGIRRQDVEPVWVRNGAVYIATVSMILAEHTLIGDQPLLYPMSEAESLNIDVPEDLVRLRAYLSEHE